MRRAALSELPDLLDEESWEEDDPSEPVFTPVASEAGRRPPHPERAYRSWYATWQPWSSS